MKDWHKLKSGLFRKQPHFLPGCDSYASVPRDELVVNTPNDLRSSVMAADPDWLRI